MGTEGSGASRAGGDGLHNEDVFLVEEGLGLYVVCDGASGSPAGEVAARTASEAIESFVEHAGDAFDPGAPESRGLVEQAMRRALSAVLEAGRSDARLQGLATTVTMLLAHGRHGVVGHWGDSRAYLIRRDRIHQLTVDHELADPSGGASEDATFEVFGVALQPGDTLVLCTDGAEQVVQRDEIVRVAGDLAPRLLASRIVSAAHRERPEHDATVLVVRVRTDRDPGWLGLSGPPQGTRFGHTLQLA